MRLSILVFRLNLIISRLSLSQKTSSCPMSNLQTEPKIVEAGGFNFKKFGCLTLEEIEWNDTNIKTREKALRSKELLLFDAIASENKLDSRASALSVYRQWQSGKLTASDSDVAASIELHVNYEGFFDDLDDTNMNTAWILYMINQRSIIDDKLESSYKALFGKPWTGKWLYEDLTDPLFSETYLPIRKFLRKEVREIEDDEADKPEEPKTVGES
jgi:hypothetical protein